MGPSQLQEFLGGVDYPAEKRTLVETARSKGADEEVIRTLEGLPMDRFKSPNDVSEAVGQS